MTQTEEIRLAVLANPGSNAVELLDACKGVEDIGRAATFLKILCGRGALSRAKIDGRFRYWPPGGAPAEEFPGVEIDRRPAHERKQDGVAPVRPERAEKPSAQLKEPEGMAVAGSGGAKVTGAQRHARKPHIPTAQPSMMITPDWCIYPHDDCVLVIHKDTQTGFRLDVEAVAAIAGLAGAA